MCEWQTLARAYGEASQCPFDIVHKLTTSDNKTPLKAWKSLVGSQAKTAEGLYREYAEYVEWRTARGDAMHLWEGMDDLHCKGWEAAFTRLHSQ